MYISESERDGRVVRFGSIQVGTAPGCVECFFLDTSGDAPRVQGSKSSRYASSERVPEDRLHVEDRVFLQYVQSCVDLSYRGLLQKEDPRAFVMWAMNVGSMVDSLMSVRPSQGRVNMEPPNVASQEWSVYSNCKWRRHSGTIFKWSLVSRPHQNSSSDPNAGPAPGTRMHEKLSFLIFRGDGSMPVSKSWCTVSGRSVPAEGQGGNGEPPDCSSGTETMRGAEFGSEWMMSLWNLDSPIEVKLSKEFLLEAMPEVDKTFASMLHFVRKERESSGTGMFIKENDLEQVFKVALEMVGPQSGDSLLEKVIVISKLESDLKSSRSKLRAAEEREKVEREKAEKYALAHRRSLSKTHVPMGGPDTDALLKEFNGLVQELLNWYFLVQDSGTALQVEFAECSQFMLQEVWDKAKADYNAMYASFKALANPVGSGDVQDALWGSFKQICRGHWETMFIMEEEVEGDYDGETPSDGVFDPFYIPPIPTFREKLAMEVKDRFPRVHVAESDFNMKTYIRLVHRVMVGMLQCQPPLRFNLDCRTKGSFSEASHESVDSRAREGEDIVILLPPVKQAHAAEADMFRDDMSQWEMKRKAQIDICLP